MSTTSFDPTLTPSFPVGQRQDDPPWLTQAMRFAAMKDAQKVCDLTAKLEGVVTAVTNWETGVAPAQEAMIEIKQLLSGRNRS